MSRHKFAGLALLSAMATIVPTLTAHAQNEYQKLSAITLTTGSHYSANAHAVAVNLGVGKPDVVDVPPSPYYGAGGPNAPTGKYGSMSPAQYLANEQRGNLDDLISGVLSNTPGVDANNDLRVYYGWITITNGYNHQNSDGSIGYDPTDCPSDYSTCMNMFMAESGHALNLLLESPYGAACPGGPGTSGTCGNSAGTNPTYATLVYGTGTGTNNLVKYGLVYAINQAASYLYSKNTLSGGTLPSTAGLYGDDGSPNRDLTDANAFAFSWLLVSGANVAQYPTNPTVYISALSPPVSNYNTLAQWFVSNAFGTNGIYTGRTLIDSNAGVLFEGDGHSGWVYDTSYAGVGLRELSYLVPNMPTYITNTTLPSTINGLPNAASPLNVSSFMLNALNFLAGRFFVPGADPQNPSSTVVDIDSTGNSRTGPMPGPGTITSPPTTTGPGAESGKATDFDLSASMVAMLYLGANYTGPTGAQRTDGIDKIVSLNLKSSIPGGLTVAHPPTLVYGEPPALINDTGNTNTLNYTIHVNQPFPTVYLYWTNAADWLPWEANAPRPSGYDWRQYMNPVAAQFTCCGGTDFSYLPDNQFWVGYHGTFPPGMSAKKINGNYYNSYTTTTSIDTLGQAVALTSFGGTPTSTAGSPYTVTITPIYGIYPSGTQMRGTPLTVTFTVIP